MKVIRVTNLKDTIEERTFYELDGKFRSLDGKVYRRDTANEGHLEKLALKDVDFFKSLFNEGDRAIRHLTSKKVDEYVVYYDTLKRAVNILTEKGIEVEIPETVIDYLNELSFLGGVLDD